MSQQRNAPVLIAAMLLMITWGSLPEISAQEAKPAASKVFADDDTNQDGKLSLEELLAGQPKPDHPRLKRDFQVVDWNHDELLSPQEAAALPLLALPAVERGEIPDPIADLARDQLKRVTESWPQWDTDGNGALDAQEFSASKLASSIPGLEQSELKLWDRNGNGSVDREEVKKVIEAAYGIRRLDGFLLRQPHGLVFNLASFRSDDVDQDGFITTAELQLRWRLTPGQAGWELAKYDQDRDGQITLQEAETWLAQDPLKTFLSADKNLDGLLSFQELSDGTTSSHRTLAKFVFPGFDQDGDGLLSFVEYRLCPLANFDEAWFLARPDRNEDGQLSPEEFGWGREIESVAVTAMYFSRFDTSGDGQLSPQEFFVPVNPGRITPQFLFAARDTNHDEKLSLEEFLTGQPQHLHARLTRDFRIVDWNGDSLLTLPEATALPTFLGDVKQRSETPDPVSDLVQVQLGTVAKSWSQWDADGNGSLNEQEFSATKTPRTIPGLEQTDLKTWDLNTDGHVDREEVTKVIERAYGLRDRDGFLLRQPNGLVFDQATFRALDVDQDGFLGVTDWQLWKKVNAEQSAVEIARADQDHDGRLSPEEARDLMARDPLQSFLDADKDFDGLLSATELPAAAANEQKTFAKYVLPGFDKDGDGQLSFTEFRLSPLANFDEPWHLLRTDRDHDGLLSPTEFCESRGIDSAAITALTFAGLDVSKDGQLVPQELAFQVQADKLTPSVLFASRDLNQDGKISLEELLSREISQEHPRLTRDFRVVDWNADGVLSLQEFTALPMLVKVAAQRQDVPDPVADLAREQLQRILSSWPQWDTDGSGSLSIQEFLAAKPQSTIPGLEQTIPAAWDLDAGGSIDRDEVKKVIEAAYGVRHLSGLLLRKPDGTIFSQSSFRYLDADKDGFLGAADLQLRRKTTPEKAAAEIAKYDRDQDGKLSLAESWRLVTHDPLKNFLAADTTLDGLVSREELLAAAPDYQKEIARFVFPGSDRDGDGQLSFREYRMCLLANPQEAWNSWRTDLNADGRLSWEEFHWGREIESVAVTALMFASLDVSQDGLVDQQEFVFSTKYHDPRQEFQRADKNGDSLLDFEEYRTFSTNTAALKRDFRLFDADHDEKLSYEEYLHIPFRTMPHQRIADADPIVELADTAFAQLQTAFTAADQNHDEILNDQEFRNGRVSRQLPGLQLSVFKDWDRNGDGKLTSDELRQVVDVAYGIRDLDGIPYRTSSGIVYQARLYRDADKDKDGRLSREEYLKYGYGGKTATEKFEKADTNQDGFLTFQEWTAAHYWGIDPISQFLYEDKDYSGTLSATELLNSLLKGRSFMAERTVAIFDADGDGELSLAEYRRTPLANHALATWLGKRTDRDGDGLLTPGEFYSIGNLALVSLTADYFDKFDQNHDGKLSLDEMDFSLDVMKAPAEIAFRYADGDQDNMLTLDELLIGYQGKTDTSSQAAIGRREELFLAADRDGDKKLSLTEFREGRDQATAKKEKSKSRVSTQVARNKEEPQQGNYRFWAILAVNVLLVGGVGWYAISRS